MRPLTLIVVFLLAVGLVVWWQSTGPSLKDAERWYDQGRYEESLEAFRYWAERGEPYALSMVGQHYHNGNGVDRDPAEAMRWYRRAADRGFAPAMFNIGCLYEVDGNINPDAAQARHWYRTAAEHSDRDAMYRLALLLYDGRGGERDLVQSHRWFRRASAWEQPSWLALRIHVCARELNEAFGEPCFVELVGIWSDRVLAFTRGRLTADDLLAEAGIAPEGDQARRFCIAHFYIGMEQLLDGQRDEAIRSFKASVETGAPDEDSLVSARCWLARLGSG